MIQIQIFTIYLFIPSFGFAAYDFLERHVSATFLGLNETYLVSLLRNSRTTKVHSLSWPNKKIEENRIRPLSGWDNVPN